MVCYIVYIGISTLLCLSIYLHGKNILFVFSYTWLVNKVSIIIVILVVILGTICVLVFGACAKDPRLYRLPMPQYNYFGAGFGLMVICTLAAGFCFAFIIGDIKITGRSKDYEDDHRRKQ